jgi:LmbE family N-acetylglucosaminyl deacetylase
MSAIPAGPLLLVSPHLDDAILSCEALVAREEPIDVVTVFAGAPEPPQLGWWDARTGFPNSDESVAARRREDETAFAGTPHRRTYLDLLELQHTPTRTAGDRETIGRAVTEWLSRNPAGAIAIPAGAGCSQARVARWLRRLRRQDCWAPHVDHLNVRNAALDALRGSGGTPLLYEEVPYLFGAPADREAGRAAAAGGWRAEPVSVEIDRDRKSTRIAAYASQIPHISPDEGRLDDPRILPRVERYWLLRRTSA